MTVVLAAVTTIACSVPAGLVFLAVGAGPQFMGSSADPGAEHVAILLFMAVVVVVVVVVVRYEVVTTARTGQTLGKKMTGIAVERFGNPRDPGSFVVGLVRGRYWARWALPHVSGFVAAWIGAGVSVSTFGVFGLLVGAGTCLVGWMTVYASALFDSQRRGWHDKLAGTIVVRATDDVLERLAAPETASRVPLPKDRPPISRNVPQPISYVEYWDTYLAERDRPAVGPKDDEPDGPQ